MWKESNYSVSSESKFSRRPFYPCAGLFRFLGALSFTAVSIGVYHLLLEVFKVTPLNMQSPLWTVELAIILIVSVLLGGVAGLIGASLGMQIRIKNENLCFAILAVWHFAANGSLIWLTTIGITLSIILGKEASQRLIIEIGITSATISVLGIGIPLGVMLGLIYYIFSKLKLGFIFFFLIASIATNLCAHFNLNSYGLHSNWAYITGLVYILLTFIITLPMIRRDYTERQRILEKLQKQ